MEPGTELRAGHGTGAKALLARALSGALNVPAFADSDVGRIVSATAPVAAPDIPFPSPNDVEQRSIASRSIRDGRSHAPITVANGAYEFVSKSAVTGKQ